MTNSYYVAPTEKQIKFVGEIAYALGIVFPTCSQEYNKWTYQQFIAEHINSYQELLASDPSWYDDEMDWWNPHAEGGY